MTIAIQRNNGDLIWLDAVLSYRKDYTSSVSRHPIEDGSSIVDNVSKENARFSVSGVISNADFNTTRPYITTSDADAFGLSNRQIYNSQPMPSESTVVIGAGQSPLLKNLPQSIGQFVGTKPPSVEVPDYQRPDWTMEVQDILTSIEREHELISVLEFKGNLIQQAIFDCYITSLGILETPDTGDAFEVDIQFEQVVFVQLRTTTLSDDVVKKLRRPVASKDNKGNVSAPISGVEGPSKEEPTEFAPIKGVVGKALTLLKSVGVGG